MAHYDCSNCGESMGVGFGSCSSCTPKEFNELKAELRNLQSQCDEEWKALAAQRMAEIEAERIKHSDNWMRDRASKLRERLHELQMEHHRSYRWEHERAERTRMTHPMTGDVIHVEPGTQIPLFP